MADAEERTESLAEWHVGRCPSYDCGRVGQALDRGFKIQTDHVDRETRMESIQITESRGKRSAWMRIDDDPEAVFLVEYADGSIAAHYSHDIGVDCIVGVIPPEIVPFARKALDRQSKEFSEFIEDLIKE